jgi:thiamine biosynthesis lipoprotein
MSAAKIFSRLPAILLLLMAVSACRPGLYKDTRRSMSTYLTVIVAAERPPDWEKLFALADAQAARFDYRREQSPLWRLNREGKAVLDAESAAVLRSALEIAEASGGAFDPTLLPVTELWAFETGGRLPAPEQIRAALARTGFREVALKPGGEAALPAGFGLDLGGIAKGAVVDLLAGRMLNDGQTDFLIEAGGDILVSGRKPGGDPWVIAIRHPRKDGALLGMLRLGSESERSAVVTSGDYERYFERNGVRYHHILNPATGAPARGLASVTVIAPTATEADGLATAAFVLGMDKGLQFLEEREHVEGLLIEEAGGDLRAAVTGGFPLSPQELALNE